MTLPRRRVADFPLAMVVLLPGDIEEQWGLARQECKDNARDARSHTVGGF